MTVGPRVRGGGGGGGGGVDIFTKHRQECNANLSISKSASCQYAAINQRLGKGLGALSLMQKLSKPAKRAVVEVKT